MKVIWAEDLIKKLDDKRKKRVQETGFLGVLVDIKSYEQKLNDKV